MTLDSYLDAVYARTFSLCRPVYKERSVPSC